MTQIQPQQHVTSTMHIMDFNQNDCTYAQKWIVREIIEIEQRPNCLNTTDDYREFRKRY